MIKVTNIGPEGAREFEIEFQKHPEAFLRVHHPSCGHCKDMEKDWKDLEKNLELNYKGDLGVFDIHADALKNISTPVLKNIQGYPTIMAIKNNTSTQYNGDRSTDDMLNFCLKHLNLEEILKAYKGGKSKLKKRKTRKRKTRKRKTRKRKTRKRKTRKRKTRKRKTRKRKTRKRKTRKRKTRKRKTRK